MKVKQLIHLILFIGATISVSVKAQTKEEITALENIGSTFNEGKSSPGGVITVAKNGIPFYNKAFGTADLEHGIENTVSTIFEAGSVSKQFTATAALLLINDGKLTLEDDVRKYIPELPDYGGVMKVKHLLTHTSGLKDWGSVFAITGWPRGTKAYQQSDAREIIFKQKTLNFLPGEEYSYSNSNFTLLATLVERIAKVPFAEFCKKRIFEPVGMTNTRWRDNFREIVKNRAVGYMKRSNEFFQDMPFENTHGHGGLLTTTADMLKWIEYWNNDGFGAKLSEMRLTPGTLNNGKQIEYTYGAVFFRKTNGVTEIAHSGLTAGYRGWLAYYPEKKITVACLGNGLTLPSKQLSEVFTGKKKSGIIRGSQSLSEEEANKLQGLYKSIKGNETLEVVKKDKKAYMKTGAEVLHHAADTFSTGSRYMKIKPDYSGFISITGADTLSFVKIDKFTPTAQELQKYTGSYFSEECNTRYEVSLKDKKLFVQRNAEEELFLKPVYKDGFYMNGILLEFKTQDSKTTSFSASVERAQNIVFIKQ